MKEKIQAIAEMHRQWRLVSDHIQELCMRDFDNAASLKWDATVLEMRCKDCVAAMRKVVGMIEKEENNETDQR